jgi:hypothetical protein
MDPMVRGSSSGNLLNRQSSLSVGGLLTPRAGINSPKLVVKTWSLMRILNNSFKRAALPGVRKGSGFV